MIRSHTISIALAALTLAASGTSAHAATPITAPARAAQSVALIAPAKVEQRVRVRQRDCGLRGQECRQTLVVILRRMFRGFGD